MRCQPGTLALEASVARLSTPPLLGLAVALTIGAQSPQKRWDGRSADGRTGPRTGNPCHGELVVLG